jgi:hypothetical protein
MKSIFQRPADDGRLGLNIFMPPPYGKIISGRESKKMRGALIK